MNATVRAMAEDMTVHWAAQISRIERYGPVWHLFGNGTELGLFDAVVLAIPVEQALPYLSLHAFNLAMTAAKARSEPCWAAMFVFDQPVRGPADIIRDRGLIGWAARNGAKPDRSGPEAWLVQATPAWSAEHLECSGEAVEQALFNALGEALGLTMPAPVSTTAHRWRFARSAGLGIGALWDGATGIGACGDWLLAPRVECAWLSGRQLAEAIATSAIAAHPAVMASGQ